MNKLAILTAATLVLTSCASQPKNIQTSYSSTLQFDDLDCDQLSIEAERTSSRATELYNSLKKTADTDAIQMGLGLIVAWPFLFFLEGGDGVEAQEFSRLKGEREAIEKVSLKKKCDIQFQPIVPIETKTEK